MHDCRSKQKAQCTWAWIVNGFCNYGTDGYIKIIGQFKLNGSKVLKG